VGSAAKLKAFLVSLTKADEIVYCSFSVTTSIMKPWNIDIPIQPLAAPEADRGNGHSIEPRTETLRKGSRPHDSKALTCDILVEHDYCFQVRDGAKLYADIYRPPTCDEKVPAIICWGPFGKKFNGIQSLKLMTPWDLGVQTGDALSGLEKFEAPDPADFVPRGYAIINIDSRGAYESEGVMAVMGTQEAEDGYDVVEACAKLAWCNGKVGLAGNSHLAIIQWFIAALNPPSLAAIAPWEGCGDLYREQFARGGIYGGDLFDNLIVKYMLKGRHGMESFRQMYDKYPLANEWWNDKRPDMTKISVPTYITGTWSNTMHGKYFTPIRNIRPNM
jgi:predicted acyl esterase